MNMKWFALAFCCLVSFGVGADVVLVVKQKEIDRMIEWKMDHDPAVMYQSLALRTYTAKSQHGRMMYFITLELHGEKGDLQVSKRIFDMANNCLAEGKNFSIVMTNETMKAIQVEEE